jgi:hypothetical protein
MMKMKVITSLLILFVMSCSPSENPPVSMENKGDITERLRVVNKTGLDGCGFLLQKADSTLLEPVNLPSDFSVDQIQVIVSYRELSDRMSVCMAGKIIQITEIKLVKP